MGIMHNIKKAFTRSAPIAYLGGGNWEIPPEASAEGYFGAYRTIGTLHAVVSRIASAVGETKWRLYKVNESGKRKEIMTHPLLTLLRYVNPFQTGNELFEITQMHLDIAGRAFWVINPDRSGQPTEIWAAEPQKMHIIPDTKKFIGGYKYVNGTNERKFNTDEVIYFVLPDPGNPYGAASPVKAVGADIDIENFTRQWERRFFFNNAEPRGIVSLPGADEEDLERFKEEWKKNYSGYYNAHKLAFINAENMKYERTGSNQKEMDFWRSSKANRDRLLLGLGMPLSVMGISENVNRANAEAGEFLFTRWVVRPRLVRIREKLNEQLVPKFGKDLELDFDEPVPETKDMRIKAAESGVKNGYLTINEARQELGYDTIPSGDVLLVPMNMIAQPTKGDLVKPPPEEKPPEEIPTPEEVVEEPILPKGSFPKPRKTLFKEEADKEGFWKAYADKAEQHEKPIIRALQEMFEEQEKEVLSKLSPGIRPESILDQVGARSDFIKVITPKLRNTLTEAFNDGENLVKPQNPHKQKELVSEEALQWLETRIGWAAEEVSEKTSEMLGRAISAGFEAGEPMDVIAERVKGVFEICSDSRALKIARTEVIMASNEGALFGYAESGVVEKAEFFAALDERVCEECEDLHEMVRDLVDSHGIIPVHPDCRCVWLPVI